jgi:iron(III) transport system permease protein
MLAQAALILGAAALVASVVRPRRATGREPLILDLGRWRVHASLLAMGLLVLIAGVPLGNLVYKAGLIVEQAGATRWRHWSAACLAEALARGTTDYRREFQWTAVISGLAATLAVVMGAILGWLARRGGRRAWPALVTATVGLAVPGPLLGLAVLWLRNQELPPGLLWLYDRTVAAPVLTATVRCLPLAILISWTAWRTLADDVLDAAACDGAGAWSRFWRIAVPQRWLALSAAWLAAFAVSAGDLATSILVVPPGMATVPIRVFGLIHAGVDQQVAALCLLAAAGYAGLAGLVVALSTAGRSPRLARRASEGG